MLVLKTEKLPLRMGYLPRRVRGPLVRALRITALVPTPMGLRTVGSARGKIAEVVQAVVEAEMPVVAIAAATAAAMAARKADPR